MVTAKSKEWSDKYRRDVRNLQRSQEMTSSRSKVFICLEVKWLENDEDTILEIGMAILDLREGKLRPNRFPPSTWSIKPRQIIIRENIHTQNGPHARANKFGFKFGKPYIARLESAIKSIRKHLARFDDDEKVYVGQRIKKDIELLQDLGVEFPASVTMFDTMWLDRAYHQRVNEDRKSTRLNSSH